MPFKKDDPSINRQGRPKGKSNSYSVKLREQINEYCEENMDYFLQEIKGMRKGYAKAQAFLTLLNYVLPKLTESNSEINLSDLSEEQLNSIIERYLKNEND